LLYLNRSLLVATDRQRLPGNVLAGIAGEKQGHVRDVLRADEGPQRNRVHKRLLLLRRAHTPRLRFGGDHMLDAVALDIARLDAVYADAVGPRLHGKTLGESDDTPLRRR